MSVVERRAPSLQYTPILLWIVINRWNLRIWWNQHHSIFESITKYLPYSITKLFISLKSAEISLNKYVLSASPMLLSLFVFARLWANLDCFYFSNTVPFKPRVIGKWSLTQSKVWSTQLYNSDFLLDPDNNIWSNVNQRREGRCFQEPTLELLFLIKVFATIKLWRRPESKRRSPLLLKSSRMLHRPLTVFHMNCRSCPVWA